MVVGLIPSIVRLGQVVYKVYRFQDRAIGKAYRGFPRGVGKGVQHGAGLGTIVGSAIEFYKDEEQGGNMIGVPQRIQQRQYNKFQKGRGKVFGSFGRRRLRKNYCYRPRKKYR